MLKEMCLETIYFRLMALECAVDDTVDSNYPGIVGLMIEDAL